MKYFVDKNFIHAVNPKRNIANLINAPDMGRGILDDKYMARYKPVLEILQELALAQKMGFCARIDMDTQQYVFDVIKGMDRTRDIFIDVMRNTAEGLVIEHDCYNLINVFYATKSGEVLESQSTTIPVFEENEPMGIARVESHTTITVDETVIDIVGDMKNQVLKMAEDFKEQNSFTVEMNSHYQYNKEYGLGDLVTAVERRIGMRKTMELTEVTHNWSGLGYTRVGVLGEVVTNQFEKKVQKGVV